MAGTSKIPTSAERSLDAALRADGLETTNWRDVVGAPDRLAAVQELESLFGSSEPSFDRLTRLARRLLGGSISMLSFIDAHGQHNKSVDGAEGLDDIPIEGSFCRHVVSRGSPILVPDGQRNDTLRALLGDNPLGIHSYAGVPLTVGGEHVVGVLCVLDKRPRQFTAEELETLEDVASLVADQFALRRTSEFVAAQRGMLRAVVDGIEEGVLVVDTQGEVLLKNRAYVRSMGGPDAAALRRLQQAELPSLGLYATDGSTRLELAETPMGRLLGGANAFKAEVVYRPDGADEERFFHVSATPLRRADGSLLAGITVIHDVSEARRGQREREAHELLLATVLGNLPGTAVFMFDATLRFLLASGETMLERIGLTESVVGKSLDEVVLPHNLEKIRETYLRTLAGEELRMVLERNERVVEVRTLPLRAQDGRIERAVALVTDITDSALEQRSLEQQARTLQTLSLTDELTGLHNRRGFVAQATRQLEQARRNRRPVAMIYLDVDDLKPVNDGLGHEHGDRLLQDVGQILRRSFRESDVLARLGGDEFAVLAVDVSAADGELLEARLARAAQSFNEQNQRPYKVSVSVGIERSEPGAEETLETLMARADARMYSYKVDRKRRAGKLPPR